MAGTVNWSVALPLYAGGVCWTLVYDTIYAHQVLLSISSLRTSCLHTLSCLLTVSLNQIYPLYAQDKSDDVKIGVRSTALLFGAHTRSVLTAFSASTVSLFTLAGYMNTQGLPYYFGVSLAALQLARILRTVDFESRESCWEAFKACGWAGVWLWAGATIDYGFMLGGVQTGFAALSGLA